MLLGGRGPTRQNTDPGNRCLQRCRGCPNFLLFSCNNSWISGRRPCRGRSLPGHRDHRQSQYRRAARPRAAEPIPDRPSGRLRACQITARRRLDGHRRLEAPRNELETIAAIPRPRETRRTGKAGKQRGIAEERWWKSYSAAVSVGRCATNADGEHYSRRLLMQKIAARASGSQLHPVQGFFKAACASAVKPESSYRKTPGRGPRCAIPVRTAAASYSVGKSGKHESFRLRGFLDDPSSSAQDRDLRTPSPDLGGLSGGLAVSTKMPS